MVVVKSPLRPVSGTGDVVHRRRKSSRSKYFDRRDHQFHRNKRTTRRVSKLEMAQNRGSTMTDTEWWKRAVIYQIYPRSFQDSDGDGIGDLNGIRRRLDYLAWLGVNAIWISPIFPSPMADFGYDISDYCAIAPLFGTIADFDALVREARLSVNQGC